MKIFILLLSVFLSFPSFSKPEAHHELWLLRSLEQVGEISLPSYAGSSFPKISYDTYQKKFFLDHDFFIKNYFEELNQFEVFDLQKEVKSILSQTPCSDYSLALDISYIRYLYRLLVISYIFEALKDYHATLYELGFNRNQCSLSWRNTFFKCSPKGEEMQKFLERIKGQYLKTFEESHLVKKKKTEIDLWLKKFTGSLGQKSTPSGLRISLWARKNKIRSDKISLPKIEEVLSSACEEDKDFLMKACSESDILWGLSKIPSSEKLLKMSNTMNALTSEDGAFCLERFSKMFSSREESYSSLIPLFEVIEDSLSKKNKTYLQGDLFLMGALKEFEDKGLENFLVKTPTPTPTPLVTLTPKPTPKIIVTVKPTPTPIKTILPPPILSPTPIVLSAFEEALAVSRKQKFSSTPVDMERLKKDYVFTKETLVYLEGPIKKYQTRAALMEMKKFDHYGTERQPIQLKFIRYLIDNNGHQGLYNILNVIGPKFYVVNDLEEKKIPVYIQLKNDASTKNQWQIFILQD